MAFGVKIDGDFLDLYPSSTVSYQINTELWVTGDPSFNEGSYTFPIDVPLTPKNKRMLGYSYRIDNARAMPVIPNVTLYMGERMSIGLPIFSGDLHIKNSGPDKASIFIVISGPNSVKNTKFSDVDMGVYNLGVPVSLKAVMDYAADNPLSSDFVFFPVQNKSLYYALSTETADNENIAYYNGYYNETINRFVSDSVAGNDWWWNIVTNPEWEGNLMISPYLRLEYVLEKTVEKLGYTLDNQFMTNEELRSICIWNNTSINDLETVYKEKIRYNEHLPPNMTLVEFLKSICAYFFIGLFVDHTRKVISLIPYRDVVKQPHRADWTYAAIDDYTIEQDNKVPFALVFQPDSSDEYFSRKYVSDLVLEFDGAFIADYWKAGGDWNAHGLIDGYYNVKRNGARFRYDPSRTNPFEKWTKNTHRFNGVAIGGRGDTVYFKVVPLFDDDVEMGLDNNSSITIPRCEIPMNIKVKNGDEVKEFTHELTSIRLTIYRGRRTFPGKQNAIPYANNSAYDPANESETFDHSLHLDGDKGIYKLYGESWMEFMKTKKIVNRRLKLKLQDILNFREWQKVRIDGMNYFVKSIKITATSTGIAMTDCELVTIPFS